MVGRRFRVVGRGREAAYVEDDGFVVVLTVGRPVLPNGVQVGRLPSVGDEVVAARRGVGSDVCGWRPLDLVADGPDDLVEAVEHSRPDRWPRSPARG